jgi:hypothetical protein
MLGGEPLAEGLRKRRAIGNIGFMADREDRATDENTHDSPKPLPLHDPERLLDDLSKEYYAIVDILSRMCTFAPVGT